MSETALLGLPLMEAAQAQKHVTHNEALLLLDAAIQLSVASRGLASPPGAPADGDRYLVAAGAGGAWAGHDGQLAFWQAGAWRFATPRPGWRLWVEDEAKLLVRDGSAWRDIQAIDSLSDMSLLGVNATADAANRLTVASPNTLFTHEGGGHLLKVNKQAAEDTASLLFQTGFSGRAEMGLAGDDNFHVKVSGDGSLWREAMVADAVTGAVSFPNSPAFAALADGQNGDIRVAGGNWLVERSGGAAGDGIADDTAALQSVLSAGQTLVLHGAKSYRITGMLQIMAPHTGIIGNGARIIMSMAPGHFDNGVYANRYATNAVGIYGEAIDGVFVRNLRIAPDGWVDERYLKPLYFWECDGLTIEAVEAWGFSRVRGLVSLDDCDRATIRNCHFHDCWTNSPAGSASEMQITGIDVDDGADVGSRYGIISGCRFENLTTGELARAAIGYQADGINLQGIGGVKPTRGWIISGCSFNNLGDGVDIFGDDNIVTGNSFRRCFGTGIKLIHGASRNRVSDNVIVDCGLAAVLLGGSAATAVNADANQISNNTIRNVMIGGDWANADGGKSYDASLYGGAPAWAAATTAGIRLDTPAGATSVLTNTVMSGNDIDLGGTGKHGIFAEATAGGSATQLARHNRIVNFAVSDVLDNAGRIEAADRAVARDDAANTAWNGNFERGDTGWLRQSGWAIVSDPANARNGNGVAVNTSTSGAATDLRGRHLARISPGETVYAEAWIRSSPGAVFDRCRILIWWYDKDGAYLSASPVGNNFASEQLTYAATVVTATAPAGAAYYGVNVQIRKTAGTIWVDDISSRTQANAATSLRAGTVTAELLGSGTANATTFLRGDGQWSVPGVASAAAALAADVQLTASNTFHDGPLVSLAAGTWLVMAHATFQKTTTTASQVTARISDGSTHFASQNIYHASVANITLGFALSAVVVLGATTDVKLQMATTAGNAACLMKATAPNNGSGGNATQIMAIRLA